MITEILIPFWLIFFTLGMGLHAKFVSLVRNNYPQLHQDLDEPSLFSARNLKAQNFIAKQTFYPDVTFEDLTKVCRILFWAQAVYVLLFISVAISIFK